MPGMAQCRKNKKLGGIRIRMPNRNARNARLRSLY